MSKKTKGSFKHDYHVSNQQHITYRSLKCVGWPWNTYRNHRSSHCAPYAQKDQYLKQLRLYFWWKYLSKQPSTLATVYDGNQVRWLITVELAIQLCCSFFFHGRNGYGSPIKSCKDQIVEGSNFIGSGRGNWYSHTICGL